MNKSIYLMTTFTMMLTTVKGKKMPTLYNALSCLIFILASNSI